MTIEHYMRDAGQRKDFFFVFLVISLFATALSLHWYIQVSFLDSPYQSLAAVSPSPHPLDTLQPRHWYEVPNSKLRDVGYATPPFDLGTYHPIIGGFDPNRITVETGGAYDSKRNRLIVWGGGHGSYAGNELYAFDINTLTWSRLNEASNPGDPLLPAPNPPYYADGKPRARHSYDYIEYIPVIDRFCSFGVFAVWPAGGGTKNNVDCFNFDTKQWERKGLGNIYQAPYSAGSMSAYDPVTGLYFVHAGQYNNPLVAWDPVADVWTTKGVSETLKIQSTYQTAEIDPIHRTFVSVGHPERLGGTSKMVSWHIDQPGTRGTILNTTGPGVEAIVNKRAPGFVWYPKINKFVAWRGGADVYTLDPVTLVWERISPAPTSTAVPPQPHFTGVYGRFRYIPEKDVFIGVTTASDNVFFYKFPTGAPPPQTPLGLERRQH